MVSNVKISVQATTVVFHQFETGLREGTIYTKVKKVQIGKMETKSKKNKIIMKNTYFLIDEGCAF